MSKNVTIRKGATHIVIVGPGGERVASVAIANGAHGTRADLSVDAEAQYKITSESCKKSDNAGEN